jgi:hypothetical protein
MTFFDHHDARLLAALGYEKTHHPMSWKDVGDAENGPRLSGGPAYDAWVRTEDGMDHCIIVCEGQVMDSFYEPTWGEQP